MALDLPRTLTPSKVTAFTNCPLAFRFTVIEHRPEPPVTPRGQGNAGALRPRRPLLEPRAGGPHAGRPPDTSWRAPGPSSASDPEFIELALGPGRRRAFLADADTLVDNYFRLEDPTTVHTIGVELGVEIESRTACGCAASSTGSTSAPTAP
jgi:putative RecB family exonuclease